MSKIKLDSEQQRTVNNFQNHPLSIITGGPGTGKSFVTKMMVDRLEAQGLQVGLCAPSGKAAKRLSQACDYRTAYTIHRMLGASITGMQWRYNEGNPIMQFDWIFVDEASMVNIELAQNFLNAIPLETNIVFIGDIDQLAPVGPGAFFRDIILCGAFPVFRLVTNHRQGDGSLIAENAMKINRGSLQLKLGNDFRVVLSSNPIDMRLELKKILLDIKKDFNENFLHRVQVLSPQHKTAIGVQELNTLLRFWINQKFAQPYQPFSQNDKVMQIVNDYDLGLFNGDVGQIKSVAPDKYVVEFEGYPAPIEYPRKPELFTPWNQHGTNMILAYCSTVHKFQGSECDAGVLILSSAHTWMLTRNLLYTGMTRFKKRCVLLADKPALKRAILNDREKVRNTKLRERLIKGFSEKLTDGSQLKFTEA